MGRWQRLTLYGVAAAAGVAVCSFLFGSWRTPLPELPEFASQTFPPEVHEQLQEAFDEARANPRRAEAIGRLGMVLQAYEQYRSAAACYLRASRLDPRSFDWAYYLGLVQISLGDKARAAETLREAVRLDPRYLPARLKLAEALLDSGDVAGSRKIYDALAGTEAVAAETQYGLARVEIAQGNLGAAVERYHRACDRFPDFGAAHYGLALAYRKLGRTAESEDQLSLYKKHKLDRPPTQDHLLSAVNRLKAGALDHLRRSASLAAAGRLDEAILAARRALEIDPQLVQVHTNLISLYGRMGQPHKAEQEYREGLRVNPVSAELHYNFGVLASEQGKVSEASDAFQKAIEINPAYAEAHHNLGFMRERQGRFADAIREYSAAIRSDPGFRLAHYHLGRLLLARGAKEEAILEFQKTITPEDDKTPTYMFGLAAAYQRAGDRQKAVFYGRGALERASELGQTELAATIDRDLRNLERARP